VGSLGLLKILLGSSIERGVDFVETELVLSLLSSEAEGTVGGRQVT
jgi:hypothetical protein